MSFFRRNSELEAHSKAALFLSDKEKQLFAFMMKDLETLQTLTNQEFLIPRIQPKKRWVKTTGTPSER